MNYSFRPQARPIDRYNVQWTSEARGMSPRERFYELLDFYGPPDLIDPKKGGMAIWLEKTLKARGFPFTGAYIKDEAILHNSPAPHADFFYTSMKLDIPEDLVCDVLQLSKSVTYDRLKREITARCHFNGANFATLYLAALMARDIVSISEVKAEGMYGKLIMATNPDHKSYDPGRVNFYLQKLHELKD